MIGATAIVSWSDKVDEILGGDLVVMLVYATPANGTVLLPVNNYAVARDRDAMTLTAINSSVGGWRKRWLRAYALRVEIELAVERVVAWPDLACEGAPAVYGAALPPGAPASQKPPGKGTGPRLDARRAGSKLARLPHVLLGWVDEDGYPVAVPVGVRDAGRAGISLEARRGLVPSGNRRAGLTGHWFSDCAIGQNQRKHTGWLEEPGGSQRLLYAPHTQSNYRLPPSKTLYRLVLGGVTRWELRGARRAGVL